MNASRAQRRRLQVVQDKVDRIIDADERFFARFPGRSHYLRLSSAAEMEANAIANGWAEIQTQPGQRWYCAVKQIAPGVRVRVYLENDPGLDTDLSEWQAAYVYGLVASPGSQAKLIEQQIRAAVAKRGGA